jgi:hypothetical protein
MSQSQSPDLQHALVSLLLTTMRQLADAGEVETACRLAGQACALLRRTDPQAMQRFNVLLHRLSLSPAYRNRRVQARQPRGPGRNR